ncbi:hypothetical protein [Streptacidiphilus fuscans]|uniref:Uncharacterized protein n=1 Tax=Streptacidiphilus fuscans TaxID=2789292 RepID=A0A931B8Z9_9ACTN|nr:hypothetical protein [Streptacidiphilus fuscans]MBF9071236.1 hypothetical protein [Streptacidiphilus fuscans]
MTTEETPAATAVLSPKDEKRAQRIAKHVKAFAAEHGGSADGVVEYVGASATRIAIVGADGAWGDQVAPSPAVAERAVELSGITKHENFEGELGLKVKTGVYEWRRMAGIQL